MKGLTPAAPTGSALERSSRQRDAFLLLRDMIAQGQILPGEKLLEVQVAKAFGISRSPARHALRALCDAKLVRELNGRGYQVAGRPKVETVGQVASLGEARIAPLPQWERVYKTVEQELWIRVLFGSLRITEAALSEFFGVSRTVVREVLGRMHSIEMVNKDGFGRWIAPRVSADKISELFELRAILEPEALVRAAPFVPTGDIERIHSTLRETLSNSACNFGIIGQVETDLHFRLLDNCPNKEIVKALHKTHLLFIPTLYLLDRTLNITEDMLKDVLTEHLAVVDRLRRKDLPGAAGSLRKHLRRAAARWQSRFEALSKAGMAPPPPYLTPIDEFD